MALEQGTTRHLHTDAGRRRRHRRGAADRRRAPAGGRRARRRPALGRPRLQPHRRPPGRARPAGLATYSIGFETIGDEEGDEFRWSMSSPNASPPTTTASSCPPPRCSRPPRRRDRHGRTHGQPRRRRLLPAVPGGGRDVKVVQSGQGADEVFAGYHWYQTLAGVRGDGAWTTYAGGVLRPGPRRGGRGVGAATRLDEDDPSRAFVRRRTSRPPARPPARAGAAHRHRR